MQDPKICFSDDVLPDGCSVKKGDVVAFTPYAMGKMKFIWGDDAHEFKPERWVDRNGRFRTESPYKFTAFQVGAVLFVHIALNITIQLLIIVKHTQFTVALCSVTQLQ